MVNVRMRFFVFALFTAAIVGAAGLCRGQEPSAAAIVPLGKILAMEEQGLDGAQQSVRVKGLVLGVSTVYKLFFIHDGSNGIWIRYTNGHDVPLQGQEVEISGVPVKANSAGRRSVMVTAESIRTIGEKALPGPRSLLISDLDNPANLDVWAQLEAFVVQWNYSAPNLIIKLASKDGFTDAVVSVPNFSLMPPSLHGAKLRLTGLMTVTAAMGRSFFVPDLKQMEIVQPGNQEWFQATEAPFNDVVMRKVALGRRWKVRGVLATVREKWDVVITSGQGALIAALHEPRGSDEPGVIYGDAGPLPPLAPGDEVEVVGSVLGASSQERHPYSLHASSIRVIGKGKTPVPQPMKLNEIASLKTEDRWAVVEPVVTGWIHQAGILTLAVTDGYGFGRVMVRGWKTAIPRELRGSRVRLTGVCRSPQSRNGEFMTVPGREFMTVLAPGASDPFAMQEVALEDVLKNAGMVRTRATVLAVEGGDLIYLRGKKAAVKAELQTPYSKGNLPRGAQYADGGEWPTLKPGDEVELVGYPMAKGVTRTDAGADLIQCQVRVVSHGKSLPPVTSTLKEVAEGALTSDFVEVRGRLVSRQKAPTVNREWRTNLQLTSGGVTLYASYLGDDHNTFPTLRVDDDVLVRAVVSRETERSQRMLKILSAGDVTSLGLSSNARRRQIWTWAGGGTLVTVILLYWIASLRRSHRLQAESAQLLEQKVNERTAELRQTQADLHKALAQERELSELKTRFVSMVSHEFRTPLGVIMSSVELLKHYSKRLPEDEKERQLDEIYTSTRHMGSLMEQVLLLGRVEAGRLFCKPQPMDVALLAGKIVDEVLSLTTQKCPITIAVQGDLPDAVADEALLRHILSNLVANAVKYSPSGKLVTVDFSRDGKDLVIQVIDRGIGILEKDRAGLFEAFYRGSNVGEIPGTGLGLVIVKRCVDMHHGSINVDSTPGSGTTFSVRLPVFPEE